MLLLFFKGRVWGSSVLFLSPFWNEQMKILLALIWFDLIFFFFADFLKLLWKFSEIQTVLHEICFLLFLFFKFFYVSVKGKWIWVSLEDWLNPILENSANMLSVFGCWEIGGDGTSVEYENKIDKLIKTCINDLGLLTRVFLLLQVDFPFLP